MSLVLDSSITLAFLLPEELTEAVEHTWARVFSEGAWAPGLWRLEVANTLVMAVRRGRIERRVLYDSLADLSSLWIEIDQETDGHAWHETLALAERHGLTLYDAAYLELAMRRRLALATLDGDLRRAALDEGVRVLGFSQSADG